MKDFAKIYHVYNDYNESLSVTRGAIKPTLIRLHLLSYAIFLRVFFAKCSIIKETSLRRK